MSCTCLLTRDTHTDHCPVTIANRKALRELDKFDVRCKGCSAGIVLGPPPFPGHPNGGHGKGPFYCTACYHQQLYRPKPNVIFVRVELSQGLIPEDVAGEIREALTKIFGVVAANVLETTPNP